MTALLVGLIPISSGAQVPNSPLIFVNQDAIVTSFVPAPSLVSSSGSSGGDNTQWLKVEFHYSVTPTAGKYLDSAEFKIWIEGRDMFAPDAPGKDGVAVGLTGSVTYVNIPAGKDCYGVFFVPPSTLGRYSTDHGPTDFDRKFNIHIEANVGGAKVDYFDKNKEKDPNWYQQLRVVTGMVYKQNECAFITSDTDRYPPIKTPATSNP